MDMPITGTRMRLYACLSVRYSKVYLWCYRLCRRILMHSRGLMLSYTLQRSSRYAALASG
nr:MAG TPA: hypothetical protein [Caudoviricetes sp.]